MRRHAGPRRWRHHGWLRGLVPDRNPLRRRCDRVEAAILAGLLALFLIGGPLAGLVAGRWAYDNGQAAKHGELAAWRQVPAVLLTTASQQPVWFEATARARWTAPDGVERTGLIPAPNGSAAGTTIKVWVSMAGWLRGPPLQPSQVDGQTVQAVLLALYILVVVLLCAGLVAHRVIDRRRMAAWDTEWRAIGPKWSRHG
jgi:hypothetical protein